MANRKELQFLITRCPQQGCGGELVLHAGTNFSGWSGGTDADFRCQECYLRFIITNPNSFGTPGYCRSCKKKVNKDHKCQNKYKPRGRLPHSKRKVKFL